MRILTFFTQQFGELLNAVRVIFRTHLFCLVAISFPEVAFPSRPQGTRGTRPLVTRLVWLLVVEHARGNPKCETNEPRRNRREALSPRLLSLTACVLSFPVTECQQFRILPMSQEISLPFLSKFFWIGSFPSILEI